VTSWEITLAPHLGQITEVVTYGNRDNISKINLTDCEVLQAYLLGRFLVGNIFPSYAPGGCTAKKRSNFLSMLDRRNCIDILLQRLSARQLVDFLCFDVPYDTRFSVLIDE
jgi:hypothetical protein